MAFPRITRLRFVKAKRAESLTQYLAGLKFRVHIYSINQEGKNWVLWFVPDDDYVGQVDNVDLTKANL